MAVKSSQSKATKDLLTKVVAEYNKMTSIKKHRIDGQKRALCYNMLLIKMNLGLKHAKTLKQ